MLITEMSKVNNIMKPTWQALPREYGNAVIRFDSMVATIRFMSTSWLSAPLGIAEMWLTMGMCSLIESSEVDNRWCQVLSQEETDKLREKIEEHERAWLATKSCRTLNILPMKDACNNWACKLEEEIAERWNVRAHVDQKLGEMIYL